MLANMVIKRVEVEIESGLENKGIYHSDILNEKGSSRVKHLKPIILFLRIDIFLDIIVLACLLFLQQ
jgi:hypothetical protein